jgi:hypothetical protein
MRNTNLMFESVYLFVVEEIESSTAQLFFNIITIMLLFSHQNFVPQGLIK